MYGLTFAPNGDLYGATGNNLYSIDVTTGEYTMIGSGEYAERESVRGIAFIPEPTGSSIVIMAILSLCLKRNRCSQQLHS